MTDDTPEPKTDFFKLAVASIAPGEYDLEISMDGKVGAIASLGVIEP